MSKVLSQKMLNQLDEARARWEAFIAKAQDGQGKFRVIVIGQQNNGKSTLCNALMEDWDNCLFKVSDKRETEAIQEKYHRQSGITYIDTPGFGTYWEEDEARARDQWTHANLLIFVHSIRSGELDNNEATVLQELSNVIPDIRNRLFVALSKYQEEDEEYAQKIMDVVRRQIQTLTGGAYDMGLLDSLYYQDGRKNSDDALIGCSGFTSLVNWIQDHKHVQPAFIKMFEHERSRYLKIVEQAQKYLANSMAQIDNKRQAFDLKLKTRWNASKPIFDNAWHECARYTK